MSTELQQRQDNYYNDVVSHYVHPARIHGVMTKFMGINNTAQLAQRYLDEMIADGKIGPQVMFDRYFKETLLRKVKVGIEEIRAENKIAAKRQAELDHAKAMAELGGKVRKKPGRKPKEIDVEVAPDPA